LVLLEALKTQSLDISRTNELKLRNFRKTLNVNGIYTQHTDMRHMDGTTRNALLQLQKVHLKFILYSFIFAAILQRTTVDIGQIKVQGVATCLFLCMDACGSVYGSVSGSYLFIYKFWVIKTERSQCLGTFAFFNRKKKSSQGKKKKLQHATNSIFIYLFQLF
jgi:Fibroblast growth factor